MRHVQIKAVPLLVVVAVLLGFTSCKRREIVTPKYGSVRVLTENHPVRIQTKDAAGATFITAYNFATNSDDAIYINPEGDVNFNDVIPEEYWKCSPTGWGKKPFSNIARNGCVASLQLLDDQGAFSTGRRENRLYVCTEDYWQVSDRKHCDLRSMEIGNFAGLDPNGYLSATIEWENYGPRMTRSQPIDAHDYIKNWQGDHAQRLFTGFHMWEHSNNAWDAALPNDVSGSWQEFAWSPSTLQDSTFVSGDMMSVDIGVCSEFLPWKWEDRDLNSALTPVLGGFTGNLGIAEAILEGMKENPIRASQFTEDAKRWMDTLQEVWQRPLSSEFHFRMNEGGKPQMCFVQYVAANNRLKTKPNNWYRWDQAFAAFWLEILAIGDCPTHNARVQYCGGINYYGPGSTATFKVDERTAKAYMEPYGLFRPACRKQFQPRFENEFPVAITEPAAEALTENLGLLLGGLPVFIGGDIRRIEVTPKGMYLVTAESGLDPQYGVGQCIRTLEGGFVPPNVRQSSDWEAINLPGRGITVEYP
jgi:hypothetical protein